MWHNKYIGIPFKAGGRDISGLDCWGLIRLIYTEEYNIQLPSLTNEYEIEDDKRIAELVAQYQEGWDALDIPEAGCVVIFRIFGEPTHVGLMLDSNTFIHVRQGSNTVTDSISNTRWKNRVVGFFKYNSNKDIILNAVPHPLKTERITTVLMSGMNLEEIYNKINIDNNIKPELSKSVVIILNGQVVPRISWSLIKVGPSDTVEYRAVPGKEAVKMIALIALVYFAPYLLYSAGMTTAIAATTAAGVTTYAAATFTGYLAVAATVMAGSYLINAIAPVRPPSSEDPGSPTQQDLITGANNPFTPYGSIPVVLGKCRITPPLGAKSFLTYPEERESYLNMLLIWGYGPLTLTNFRIGEVDWDDYQYGLVNGSIARITLDRKTAVSQTVLDNFDKIYGSDVDQQFSNSEMIGPEWVASGSGGVVGSTVISGTSVNFDRLTGIIISPPEDVIPEIPTVQP